ncbi:MAG: hypothetical protein PGN09_07730 [Sphingomonas fennica]
MREVGRMRVIVEGVAMASPIEQASFMLQLAPHVAKDDATARFRDACLRNDIATASYWMVVLSELAQLR